MTTITLPTTDGGTVTLEVSAVAYTAPAPVPPPPAPTPPPPAPTPPPPAPVPPPPPAPARRSLENFKELSQPIDSPASANHWAARTIIRTPVNFSGVQLLFNNPGINNNTGPIPRTVLNHMASASATLTRSPTAWQAGNSNITVPASPSSNASQRPGYMAGSIISMAPIAAADGGANIVVVSADMVGAVWHASPDGFDGTAWGTAYPWRPLMSWRAYNVERSTPATANASASWIDMPGSQAVAGLIVHHATPAAAVLYIGDSTTDGDLIIPGVCNYQSAGWRAVNAMNNRGVPITFGRLSQGGAKWDDMQYRLQAVIDAGVCGAGVIVAIPTFTSNDEQNAAFQWGRSQTLVTMAQNAGATVLLIGPMCSTSPSQVRHDVRALMLAAGKPYVDTMLTIGSTADLSVFAAGMCGDPNGAAVHPSAAANAALAVVHDNKLTAIIG